MRVRSRKFIGTIVLLLLLAAYATLAAVIGSGRIAQAPQRVQFAFFLTTGLAWVIPAGLSFAGCSGPTEWDARL